MNPVVGWYLLGAVLPLGVLLVAMGLLDRLFARVLQDLLGSDQRARFFKAVFFAMLATATIAGSLLPARFLNLEAESLDALTSNTARQVLAAGLALLLGMGVAGGLLAILIAQYEWRRKERARIERPTEPPRF